MKYLKMRPANHLHLRQDARVTDIKTNLRIMICVIVAYSLNKFLLRPWVVQNEISGVIRIFTFSFPNLCEAVCGTIVLTNLGLVANSSVLTPTSRFKPLTIYVSATIIAAAYVILQEFKVHNLGGRNVYDFNDVLFSIAGLALIFSYLLMKKPEYKP